MIFGSTFSQSTSSGLILMNVICFVMLLGTLISTFFPNLPHNSLSACLYSCSATFLNLLGPDSKNDLKVSTGSGNINTASASSSVVGCSYTLSIYDTVTLFMNCKVRKVGN